MKKDLETKKENAKRDSRARKEERARKKELKPDAVIQSDQAAVLTYGDLYNLVSASEENKKEKLRAADRDEVEKT